MSRQATHYGFRRLCERDNLSQEDVAHACGICRAHLSNFLAGRVSAGTRERIEPRLADLFYSGDRTKLRRALARATAKPHAAGRAGR